MRLNLSPEQVHCWICHSDKIQDPQLLQQYQRLLQPEEEQRRLRFHFAKHQHQHLVTRALVRSVLSFYADIAPQDWRFSKNTHGKPEIIPPTADFLPLRFNLSHTEGMVVCAVMLEQDIGVDVEYCQRQHAGLEIAKRFFSPLEYQDLLKLESAQQVSRFFDYWTLKEAYIKACGQGISIPLDHFSYQFIHQNKIQIQFVAQRDDHPENWQFFLSSPSVNHRLALAIHQGQMEFEVNYQTIVPLQ